MIKKKTHQFGLLAERIVVWYLRFKGYRILQWRYKTVVGEIDLIAKKRKMLVFIEVKARKNRQTMEEVFLPHQAKRISRAAELFIVKNPRFYNYSCRFDLILVNKFFKPKHFTNFW